MTILRKALLAIVILLALSLTGYFLLRDHFLHLALEKVRHKFQERFGYQLQVDEASFTGLARVTLKGIALVPPTGDTVFTCKSATASFSLARFIKGQPPVNNAELADGVISLVEQDSVRNNYRALLSPRKNSPSTPDEPHGPTGPGTVLRYTWNRFLALADFNFSIRNLQIKWRAPGYYEQLLLETFQLKDTHMEFNATDSIENQKVNWIASGTINRSDEIIELEGGSSDAVAHDVPFFQKISGIKSGASHASIRLERSEQPRNGYSLNGHILNPYINHWRIAPEDVRLDSAAANMILTDEDTAIAVHQGSHLDINRLRVNLSGSFTRTESIRTTMQVEIPETPANVFFRSLPEALFASLKGMEAEGSLSYKLHFSVDTGNPDSVVFESDLDSKKFRIKKFGSEDLSMMSRPFLYEAREHDRVVKVFLTGPDNPSFTPFASIPPILVSCILTSEDGTFYHHRGFNEEAFRKSIATNIRQKRFARGGSTISMQLVKNVHLNRNKTISRKLEEALLVWIIENYGLCSKERMLEVYLNIIEWGPGIYGIHDAALYYFNKDPMSLTLEECIFLASIIPNPKAFRYSFDAEGKLRPRLEGYYRLVAGRLKGKEIITQEQLDSLHFNVTLNGPARDLVLPADSVVTDSTELFEESILPQELP